MEEKELSRLLKICRLELSEKEQKDIKKDIEEVVAYFDILENVDTKGTEVAYHPINVSEKLREDKAEQFGNVEGILKNTKTYRFYVVGPKV